MSFTNQMLNDRKEKDCIGIIHERKYYRSGVSFIKRSLRPKEWQVSQFKGTVQEREDTEWSCDSTVIKGKLDHSYPAPILLFRRRWCRLSRDGVCRGGQHGSPYWGSESESWEWIRKTYLESSCAPFFEDWRSYGPCDPSLSCYAKVVQRWLGALTVR